tara:strand:- start:250 stop:549 length:300 start_codon:yes stop_codon:yes gene_type:complete
MEITLQVLVRQPLEEVEVVVVLMSPPIVIVVLLGAQEAVALYGIIKNIRLLQRELQDKVTQVVVLALTTVVLAVGEKGLLELIQEPEHQSPPVEMEVLV